MGWECVEEISAAWVSVSAAMGIEMGEGWRRRVVKEKERENEEEGER